MLVAWVPTPRVLICGRLLYLSRTCHCRLHDGVNLWELECKLADVCGVPTGKHHFRRTGLPADTRCIGGLRHFEHLTLEGPSLSYRLTVPSPQSVPAQITVNVLWGPGPESAQAFEFSPFDGRQEVALKVACVMQPLTLSRKPLWLPGPLRSPTTVVPARFWVVCYTRFGEEHNGWDYVGEIEGCRCLRVVRL